MIYFWVALMALTFTALGFLIHAFYFSKEELVQRLYHELQTAENRLAFRERGIANAQAAIAKTRMLVQSLERQLATREEQLESLKDSAQYQDEEIRALRKVTGELRRIHEKDERKEALAEPDFIDSQYSTEPELEDQKIPLWKDSLNNILSVLNNVENEGSKQNW